MRPTSGERPLVVMGCPHHWWSPFQVAGQHFARQFVRAGWDVTYVSNPISPWHLASGLSKDLRLRFRQYRAGGLTDLDGHLQAYVPGAIVTPHHAPIFGPAGCTAIGLELVCQTS